MVKEEAYRVDFHVILNIYLQPGRELSGPDFARLWSGMTIFGNQRGTGVFWLKDTVPDGGQRPFRIGAMEPIQSLLAEGGDRPIFGGGTYSKAHLARKDSTLDCDFYYEHADASRWMGVETVPSLLFTVSGQWFEIAGTEVVLEKMKEHLEVADRYEPPYGLIDLAIPENCYAGLNYGSIFFANNYLHNWVEQANWVYAGSKRMDQARSVYWGNYFGRAILERLGGRERFLEGYRRQAQDHWPPELDGRPNALIWEFTNGVFVSVYHDPLGCKPGPAPHGISNLLWLVQELGSHGVLSHWANSQMPNHGNSTQSVQNRP